MKKIECMSAVTKPNEDVERLVAVARDLARRTPGFLDVKGPGKGDKATAEFMKNLRIELAKQVPSAKAEQKICGENGLAVDFYFERLGIVAPVGIGPENVR